MCAQLCRRCKLVAFNVGDEIVAYDAPCVDLFIVFSGIVERRVPREATVESSAHALGDVALESGAVGMNDDAHAPATESQKFAPVGETHVGDALGPAGIGLESPLALQRLAVAAAKAEREAERGANTVSAYGPDERHPCTCVAAAGNGSEAAPVVELIAIEVDELRALTTAASVRDVYERHEERMLPYSAGFAPADTPESSSGHGLSAVAASQKSTLAVQRRSLFGEAAAGTAALGVTVDAHVGGGSETAPGFVGPLPAAARGPVTPRSATREIFRKQPSRRGEAERKSAAAYVVSRIDFFRQQNFTPAQQLELISVLELAQVYGRGRNIFCEETKGRAFYIVFAGEVEVYVSKKKSQIVKQMKSDSGGKLGAPLAKLGGGGSGGGDDDAPTSASGGHNALNDGASAGDEGSTTQGHSDDTKGEKSAKAPSKARLNFKDAAMKAMIAVRARATCVATLKAGASFGERALESASSQREATIVTSSDVTELLVLSADRYYALVKKFREQQLRDREKLLARTPGFDQLPTSMLREVCQSFEEKKLLMGERLCEQGALASQLCVIFRGECRLERTVPDAHSPTGESTLDLGRAGVGTVVGAYVVEVSAF